MPILDNVPSDEHFAAFVDLSHALEIAEGYWPNAETYLEHIFFRFSDSLCDTVCIATRTFLPFDCHELTQMTRPHQILALSAELLFRARILTVTPTSYLRDGLASRASRCHPDLAVEDAVATLHHNLLDTLLFLSGRLHQIAFSKRCLTIVGF